jgi:HEAT repeat protein
MVRRFWAQAVLALCGLGAIGVLLASAFRTTHPSWDDSEAFADGGRERWTAIRRLGPRAVPILLQKIREPQRFRSDVVAALASLGPGAVPGLVAAFQDESPRVRLAAVRAFVAMQGDLEPQAAVVMPGLIRLMSDPSREIRCAAVRGMIRCGSNALPALPALVAGLRFQDMDAADGDCVQQCAAYLLGKMGPQASAAIPMLTKLLDHPSADAPREALVALWRISHDTNLIAVDLQRMFNASNSVIRAAGLAAAVRISRETQLDLRLMGEAQTAMSQTQSLSFDGVVH